MLGSGLSERRVDSIVGRATSAAPQLIAGCGGAASAFFKRLHQRGDVDGLLRQHHATQGGVRARPVAP